MLTCLIAWFRLILIKTSFITRKQNDGKALKEFIIQLRKSDLNNPSKYDFALFGIGVLKKIKIFFYKPI